MDPATLQDFQVLGSLVSSSRSNLSTNMSGSQFTTASKHARESSVSSDEDLIQTIRKSQKQDVGQLKPVLRVSSSESMPSASLNSAHPMRPAFQERSRALTPIPVCHAELKYTKRNDRPADEPSSVGEGVGSDNDSSNNREDDHVMVTGSRAIILEEPQLHKEAAIEIAKLVKKRVSFGKDAEGGDEVGEETMVSGANSNVNEPVPAHHDTPSATDFGLVFHDDDDDDLDTHTTLHNPQSTVGHKIVKKWATDTYEDYEPTSTLPSPTGSPTSSLSDIMIPELDPGEDLLTHMSNQDELIRKLKNMVHVQSRGLRKQNEQILYLKTSKKLRSALQLDKKQLKNMRKVSGLQNGAEELIGQLQYFYGDVQEDVGGGEELEDALSLFV